MVAKLEDYLKYYKVNPREYEPIPDEPDLTPDILDALIRVESAIKSIKIPIPPKPADPIPAISSSTKQITSAVNSITIPIPPEHTDIIESLEQVRKTISDKSVLLSIDKSINAGHNTYTKLINSIISELKQTQKEIQSTNSITSKSIDNIKQITTTLKSMDSTKALKEIASARKQQDSTHKTIVDNMTKLMAAVSRNRNYRFTLARDENGFLSEIIATEIQE